MKKIIDHIKQAEKRKLFIYIFSFLFFWGINNIFSNLIFYSLGGFGLFNYWGEHSIPCRLSPLTYALLFQGLKLILFVLFIVLFRHYPLKLLNEFFVAYFIYDLVYILSIAWDCLPINIKAVNMLSSSGQTVFDWMIPHLSLFISLIWTISFYFVIRKQQKINLIFLVNRLSIIPISVLFISSIIFIINRLFYGK